MRRIPTLIGVSLVAAATASAIAVTSGGAQTPAGRTITVVQREVPDNYVVTDVPPLMRGASTNPSKGDGFLYRNELLDAGGAKRVGTVFGRCSYVTARSQLTGSELVCDVVSVLKDGTLTGSALVTLGATPYATFAVTGGTGAYEGARGSGVVTIRGSVNNPLSDIVYHLRP